MDNSIDYGIVVALIKKLSGGSSSSPSGGVSQDEFDAHIVDNIRHLTPKEREELRELSQTVAEVKDNINFTNENELPNVGKEKTLYVTKNNIYQWDKEKQEYIIMNSNSIKWEDII